jgi:NAD(P)-dependent dehydrogenase (short-subunit alcohol dehydrogenase family)
MTPRGKSILSHTPMNRFGAPKDLLGATLWLISPASAFVTGIVLPVDGGFSAFRVFDQGTLSRVHRGERTAHVPG